MATDFFQQQDRAKQRTGWLLLLMAGAILGTTLILGIIIQLFLVYEDDDGATAPGTTLTVQGEQMQLPFRPIVFGYTFLGVTGVVVLAGLFKTTQLAKGGSTVAEMVGGKLLQPHTADANELKLRNVVEEMAIASGVPMPDLYILEDTSINAFAAGHTVDNAAIGVTRGCLDLLDRDELQGVIAHEFSHILNGDMRLNTRLIAIVFGLLIIALLGRILLRVGFYSGSGRSSSSGRGGGGGVNPILLIGLASMVIGYLGVLFGNMIKAAISRQREYLADASAVQFTRNPEGIAGALMKIGSAGSTIRHPEAEEVSHMFFGQGVRAGLTNMFSTHPPLVKRIQAIDPSFDGDFAKASADLSRRRQAVKGRSQPPPVPGGGGGVSVIPNAAALVSAIGAPTSHHLNQARSYYQQVPEKVRQALHETVGAQAVVLGLLLSDQDDVRQHQQQSLKTDAPVVADELRDLAAVIQEIPNGQRLPVVELAIPALRHLSSDQLESFTQLLEKMTAADNQLDLFEFALARMIQRHLLASHGRGHRPTIKYRRASEVREQIATVLSALAYLSGPDHRAVEKAFQAGVQSLNDQQGITLRSWEACDLGTLGNALDRLDQSTPNIKKNLLYACGQTVTSDREVTGEESELVRAIADGLGCPVPPMVQQTAAE